MVLQPSFISGLDLSESFYKDAVEPIVTERFPDLLYSAALIGSGSEVLGFDNLMSTDHDWGPRAMLFLSDTDLQTYATEIKDLLKSRLPRSFNGYSTSFTAPGANGEATQLTECDEQSAVNHRVDIFSIKSYLEHYLGLSITNESLIEIETADWLTIPEQKLLAITSGRVFRDDLHLAHLRNFFYYYPLDVWLYILASSWTRIEQESHLMSRAGSVGDELGSALIASRLVRDIMHLCFQMERRYAPYPKWFGSAFAKLNCAQELTPILKQVLHADEWQTRQAKLAEAYEYIAKKHNALDITPALSTKVRLFYDRPFAIISTGEYSAAITEHICDQGIKDLARRKLIGSIDQFSNSTDLLGDLERRRSLRMMFD